MNPNTIYQKRRQQILNTIDNGVAVFFAAPEQVRSNDTNYPYRQNSYFYYLTGFLEADSALILDGKTGCSILFCRKKNIEMETWNGFLYGPDVAAQTFLFDQAYTIDEFDGIFTKSIKNCERIYALWGKNPQQDTHLLRLWDQSKGGRQNVQAASSLIDIGGCLDGMRLIKDDSEIALLKEAGRISALGHVQAMKMVKQTTHEYQVEAELLHTFLRHGSRAVAYESIVASGKNACTLHYVGNMAALEDGDLLLIDAGAEYQGYAGDISRTFPVNGRFSAAQKDVYEIVLAAQLAAIDCIKPNVNWQVVSDAALRVLVQGLLDLKLLSGSLNGAIESESYRRFYMHGIGHWVGMDVHDVGGRFVDSQPLLLLAGMCTTIEPGLYINAADDIPNAFANIGIRIEDNVLVTEEGGEIYTADVPKTVAEIEYLINQ